MSPFAGGTGEQRPSGATGCGPSRNATIPRVELRNALEYAYVVGDGPVLVPADLPDEIVHPDTTEPLLSVPTATAADDERRRIDAALAQTGGHHGRAARLLGISRVTLWRRQKEASAGPDPGKARPRRPGR